MKSRIRIRRNPVVTPEEAARSPRYLGVRYDRLCRVFRARLYRPQTYNLGAFATAEEAARARDAKVRELRLPRARLDFSTPRLAYEQSSNYPTTSGPR